MTSVPDVRSFSKQRKRPPGPAYFVTAPLSCKYV